MKYSWDKQEYPNIIVSDRTLPIGINPVEPIQVWVKIDPPVFSDRVVEVTASKPLEDLLFLKLTRKQIEVLKLRRLGKTTPEIGKILGLSVSGVNFHITNINKIISGKDSLKMGRPKLSKNQTPKAKAATFNIKPLDALIKEHITQIFPEYQDNLKYLARGLGISRQTLYRYLRKYKINFKVKK